MKVKTRILLASLPAALLVLGACGSNPSAPNKDYLSIEAVQKMSCDSVDKAELQKALDHNPNAKQASAILNLNPGTTSLDPLREALRGKLNDCNGVPKQEIKGSGDPAPWPCPEYAKQNFDPNKDGNYASDGGKNTDDILALAGRDARALGSYASQSNLAESDDPNPLLIPDNTCLSQKGQDTWNMLKGALTASGTKVNLDAQAPENHYNTGMVNGRAVVDTHPGIGGDRSAIEYMFPDGSKLTILKRCLNITLPSQGNLPQAVTNHQRPPGTTVTPPPVTTEPTCPPDMPHGKPPNCKDDPTRLPNAPEGNGRNTGTGETNVYTPPPVPPYTPPPAPAGTTVVPPPAFTPTQPTGPPSTVAPSIQPTKTAPAPTDPGCGNPEFC